MYPKNDPDDSNALRLFIEGGAVRFVKKRFRKNELIVRQGEVCPWFCYVESGILQHLVEVENGEKTTYLALRNTFTSSLRSFLSGTPSRKSIKAIADSTVWVIDRPGFEKRMAEDPHFRDYYHRLIERQICLIDEYRIDLLTLTPEARYRKLLATEPKLLLEIPLRHLASFLGISDRHMSRIRKSHF